MQMCYQVLHSKSQLVVLLLQVHSATLPCMMILLVALIDFYMILYLLITSEGSGTNPFTSQWTFNYPIPPGGTWFDVWISVYRNCDVPSDIGDELWCTSEYIHRRDYVK